MKKLIVLLTMAMSIGAQANMTNTQYEEVLQEKLSFYGLVEVDSVEQLNDEQVSVLVDVSAYGETRPATCVFEQEVVVSCDNNWFNL